MTAKKRDRAPNVRREAFARHYAAGADGVIGNGRESARAAGFKGTDASLDVTASRLLRNAKVMAAVSRLHGKAEGRAVARLADFKAEVPACLDTLVEIRDGKITKGAAVRVMAVDKLLDRALGKPASKVQLDSGVEGAAPASITVRFVRPTS